MKCKFCSKDIICNNRFKKYNVFCNNSCAAKYNNLGVVRNKHGKNGQIVKIKNPNPKSKQKIISKQCIFCFKDFHGSKKQKYCNRSCYTAAKNEFNKMQWLEAKKKLELTGVAQTTKIAKRYLKEKFGYKCAKEKCGLTEWLGDHIVLTLDHINGNSEDNRIENLRLVCPNCDSQSPTYKGRNKGKGRHFRKMRYREGKSF